MSACATTAARDGIGKNLRAATSKTTGNTGLILMEEESSILTTPLLKSKVKKT